MTLPIELKPTKKQLLIDLVHQTGVNVTTWANYKNGIANPGANPKYCYEWSFQSGSIIVLTLWYDNMQVAIGGVEHPFNFRDTTECKKYLGIRKARRQRFEEAIARAFRDGLPIRVIVNRGNHKWPKDSITKIREKVSFRLLDSVPWTVVIYDRLTGKAILRRSVKVSAGKE